MHNIKQLFSFLRKQNTLKSIDKKIELNLIFQKCSRGIN